MFYYVSVSAKCLTKLQPATKSDKQLCRSMKISMLGWPDDKKKPARISEELLHLPRRNVDTGWANLQM